MLRRLRARRPRSRGQSLVEFAIVAPVALLILLMAVDFGRVYLGWITLNNIARIGANFAALNATAWEGSGNPTLRQKYRDLMAADLTGTDCGIPPASIPDPTFPDPAPATYAVGGHAHVALTCKFQLLTPFIGAVIGDANNRLDVSASAVFTIRGGAINGIPVGTSAPSSIPTSTPPPTAPPTPTSTPTSGPTGTPLPGVTVSFYGVPRPPNSQGGGPPGSNGENQIVVIPGGIVDFTNTTTGTQVSCQWSFGDGSNLTQCGGPTHAYNTRGLYDVSLTVNGMTQVRPGYVLVGCQVPDFHGVHANDAQSRWAAAGFQTQVQIVGNGNFKIGTQSLASGLLNPQGGCAGATITLSQ